MRAISSHFCICILEAICNRLGTFRHGELIQSGVLSGRTDITLSELGIEQLTDIDRIFSFPLQRCCQSATALSCRWQISLSISYSLQRWTLARGMANRLNGFGVIPIIRASVTFGKTLGFIPRQRLKP